MIAERQNRYPKGTYRIIIASTAAGTSVFQVDNLVTRERFTCPTLWQMIRAVDRNLDQTRFPQHTLKLREWRQAGAMPPQASPQAMPTQSEGTAAGVNTNATPSEGTSQAVPPRVLLLKIFHRENATWQGSLQEAGEGPPRAFQSELELIRLLGDFKYRRPINQKKTNRPD